MKKWKIFVINLAESTERMESCASQLEKYNLPFERFDAVNGRRLGADECEKLYSFKESTYYKELNVSEIGCYLSHRGVWQRILDEKLDYALVFEDDIHLQQNFQRLISSIDDLTESWDVIKLAEVPVKRKVVKTKSLTHFSFVTYSKVPVGAYAQAISFRGAQKLLTSTHRIKRPVDIDMQYWWEKELFIYGLKPYPVNVDRTEKSVIDSSNDRRLAKKSFWRQVTTRFYFLFKNKKELKKRLKNLT